MQCFPVVVQWHDPIVIIAFMRPRSLYVDLYDFLPSTNKRHHLFYDDRAGASCNSAFVIISDTKCIARRVPPNNINLKLTRRWRSYFEIDAEGLRSAGQ
jgi:hypothetical protein